MMSRNDKPTKILFLGLLFVAMSFSLSSGVHAAVKDTDADGLTDTAETNTYHTDPNGADTDLDGVSDGQEVLNGTNPLDASDSIPTVNTAPDPGILGAPEKFPWYFARAAGIFAFILLTGSTVFGLVISSRAFMKIVPGADAYELHRSISLASVIAVILHFGALLFDGFLKITPIEALVPSVFSRAGLVSAGGFDLRIPIMLGIIAFYLIVTLVLTAEFRTKMPPKVWRVIHYASFAAYPLFVIHGFMSGTDSGEGWMRAIYAFSVLLVLMLVFTRIIFRTIVPAVRRLRAGTPDDGRFFA